MRLAIPNVATIAAGVASRLGMVAVVLALAADFAAPVT